jgi:predicted hydrocarbon binding protein
MEFGLNKTKHKMLISIEKNVQALAGEMMNKKVMEGSEEITEKTDKRKIAEWVKGAMERLDSLVKEETKVQIMENCGRNCADVNKKVIERAKARRKKFKSAEEFLEAEQKKPMTGTKLAIECNMLYQFYTPRVFTRPMRCYCGLLRGLPDEETVSKTYCYCSKGFVKKFWESVLEKPVTVDLIQSAVSGADECEFAIHL